MKPTTLHLFIAVFLFPLLLNGQLTVTALTTDYLYNPVGIDNAAPRLSWKITPQVGEKNLLQTAFHIQASANPDNWENDLLWDSGKTASNRSVFNNYKGRPLLSGQRVFWRVKIWDNKNRESAWSETAFWEMGLLRESDWTAQWIEPALEEQPKTNNPAPMLRKDFSANKSVQSAQLYITAHGLYDARINGEPITDHLFTPGWTSYHHRLQYQVYDVTNLIQNGDNTIGVLLGDGWYRGEFGFEQKWDMYGTRLALLCQLQLVYTDGTTNTIVSDESWKAATGPIRYSALYDGECYDARLENSNWDQPGSGTQQWFSVTTVNHSKKNLIATQGVPVKVVETKKPDALLTTPQGERVLDFGQNMVGRVRFSAKGNSGDTLTLTHAEILDKDGNFYTANLRAAAQQVKYICSNNNRFTYEPAFTFHGFRYVLLEGFPDEVKPADFEAQVIHSDMEPTGRFECSDPMINQLQSNIRWGQKSNFLEVPTDCPQRDERMGWTGDAQVFAPTACFNYNAAPFFTKWLKDLTADQRADGAVPVIVPDVLYWYGSTGWADAATIIPWTVYLKYGDEQVLDNQFNSMKNWVDYLHFLSGDNYLVQDSFHYGDWLFFIHPTDWNAKPGFTDVDLIATAFFAHSAGIVARAATILGKEAEAKKYGALRQKVVAAFRNEYITPSGRLASNSQTAYCLALAFALLEESQEKKAVRYLVDNIKKRDYHLSTGFLGTPHLCHVLARHGYLDVAYRLLFQKEYPSWLYPISRGATTIWERWDGIKPDSSLQTPMMNSFNHYAYGAIGDWLYTTVAGIRHDETAPGYKHIHLRPQPGGPLSRASAQYESMYGTIACRWEIRDGKILLEVTIPPNTTADILLPQKEELVKLGSGVYRYEYVWKK